MGGAKEIPAGRIGGVKGEGWRGSGAGSGEQVGLGELVTAVEVVGVGLEGAAGPVEDGGETGGAALRFL